MEALIAGPMLSDYLFTMPDVKIRSSCDSCLTTKVKCSQTRPACARCVQHDRQCVYSQYRKIGRPSSKSLSASTGRTDHPQKGHTRNLGRRLNGIERQHSSQPSRESLPRKNAPLLPVTALNHSPGSSVSPSHLADTQGIPITIPKTGGRTRPALDEVNGGNYSVFSAGESILSLDPNISPSEIPAGVTSDFEYGIKGIDWPAFEGVFDEPAGQEPLFQSYEQHRFGSIAPSSCWPTRQPAGYATPRQTPKIERLFLSVLDDKSLFGGYSTAIEGQSPTDPFNYPPFSSYSNLSPLDELDLFAANTRCTSHCYLDLTNQLSRISEFQGPASNVALDVLLNLDSQVSFARDRILRCKFCLSGTGCAQTLMLLALVIANILSLFEDSCGPNSDEGLGGIDCEGMMSIPSPMSRSSTADSRDSYAGLPSTMRALILGDLQLNESIKRTLSRRLVRMYLNRQRRVARDLHQFLRCTKGSKTSLKVTDDLLQDVLARIERFIGFMTLTTRLD